MPFRILSLTLALMCGGMPVIAKDPSWKGKEVVLTRAGVSLEVSTGEKIASRTSGLAKDVTFRVLKEKNGRLLIESPRQRGWIAKGDSVLLDQAAAIYVYRASAKSRKGNVLRQASGDWQNTTLNRLNAKERNDEKIYVDNPHCHLHGIWSCCGAERETKERPRRGDQKNRLS